MGGGIHLLTENGGPGPRDARRPVVRQGARWRNRRPQRDRRDDELPAEQLIEVDGGPETGARRPIVDDSQHAPGAAHRAPRFCGGRLGGQHFGGGCSPLERARFAS